MIRFIPTLVLLVSACGDDGASGDTNELITTVTLDLVPTGGGATITAAFDDADGIGGDPPVVDPITLTAGTTYTVGIRFQNALETPPEDLTVEIADESDQHQIFVTGTAVNGPATNQPTAPLTHTYLDMDANGLPIGLSNRIVAARGAGTVIVTLRHLPPVNGTAVKTADTVNQVKTGGFGTLAGSTDATATFMATVP